MNLNRSDFEEFIEKLSRASLDEIIEAVAGDADLRGYLAATAGNLRNQADVDRWNADPSNWVKGEDHDFYHFWESTQYLKDWSWKDAEKFDTLCDRKAIAYWAPIILKALVQRMKSVHSQSVQRELDGYAKELEKQKKANRLSEFMGSIPAEFRGADVNDWPSQGARKLVESILAGGSALIWGGRGIGKTRLSYALLTKMLTDGKRAERHFTAAYASSFLSIAAAKKSTVYDVIDSYGLQENEALFLDEGDKMTNDTQREVINYLIDRRYENHLQTVMLCNAVDDADLEAKLTTSIISRFSSRKWKSCVLHLEGEDRRATAS